MSSELATLGNHVLVGLHGSSLTDKEKALLKELKPLGIILFKKNIDLTAGDKWIDSLFDLQKQAQDCSEREDFLITVDHEGGLVHRFLSPVTHFPAAVNWGGKTSAVATAMARELRALGFNLSFEPVLDINSEAANPVIGPRSFGASPEEVAAKGQVFAESFLAAGIIPVGKHFPGHGDTLQDSHFNLPELKLQLNEIEVRELLPFRHLIGCGIPALMTAHVLYSAIDADFPASLSEKIIQGILRNQLDFKGLVFTDDLEMKALDALSPQQKAVLAIRAGSDVLLEGYPKDQLPLDIAKKMLEGLASALDEGLLSAETIAASAQRIENLQNSLKVLSKSAPKANLDVLSCLEHQELNSSLRSQA